LACVKSAFGIPPPTCQRRHVPRWKARTWWILGLLLLLQLGAAVGFRSWAIQRDIERWEEYQARCRSQGEDLGIKPWLPAAVPDDDNLFTHPWVIAFLASESSPQAEAVAEMQAWPGLDLDGYEAPAEGKSWFDGREAETAAVLQAGKERADHFRAIHEAAGRGGSRAPVDFDGPFENIGGPWTRISDLGGMLAVHADAAMASGDGPAATADLEAMLRLGNHLRGGNFLLATLIGTGFEGNARRILDAGISRRIFNPADRRRLLAALRTRPVAEELAAVSQVERGMFLAALEGLVATRPPAGIKASYAAFLNPPRRLGATNSLHLCTTLDAPLAAGGSRTAWEDFDRQVSTLSQEEEIPGTEIAGFFLGQLSNVATGLFLHEDELDLLRQRLAE
jgi:hypothetical protein